jgi:hypothetical protein
MLIETKADGDQDLCTMLAPCIVDPFQKTTVQVRVMNPTCEDIKIRQDQQVGVAEEIADEVIEVIPSEDQSQLTNFDAVRRVELDQSDPVINTELKKETGEVIPNHLQACTRKLLSI